MLKSTHRAIPGAVASPLPPGWTEHKAPTGHTYYYNAETKKSTYTRPAAPPPEEELQIDFGATKPDHEVQASINALQEFHKHNDPSQPAPGHFTGGRSYQNRSRPNRHGDRPKSKASIPDCAPWVLVRTKYGRRFVHNTETKESLWKFPSEVMMAVIDMDRVEWEKKKAVEAENQQTSQEKQQATQIRQSETNAFPKPNAVEAEQPYDSDSYEEVEVTDSEGEGENNATKKPRLESDAAEQSHEDVVPAGPQELNEDDIAFQLAALEAEEDDPGYDYNDPEAPFDFSDEDLDDDGGVPLTKTDREALFRSLLDEHNISPFSTFDALIDTNTPTANAVISDHRWVTLPNMSSRRATFDLWSRDRVAERNTFEDQDKDNVGTRNGLSNPSKPDPRVAYLKFLSINATPKLYWPEFKRKFRKDPEMTDRHFADKDREKLYREYIPKLKLSDSDRRKEFTTLLKSVSRDEWKNTDVPASIKKDIRYYGVRDETRRKELVDAFVGR